MASGGRFPNSSTTMSLHERFSKLKNASGGRKLGPNVQQDRRQAAALLHKASIKNSRLAQQMERRAANITALTAAQKLKKKSIKQRLGNQPTYNTGGRIRGALTQQQKRGAPRGKIQNRGGRGAAGAGTSSPGRIKTMVITRGGGGRVGRGGRAGKARPNAAKNVITASPAVVRGGRRGRGVQQKGVVAVNRGNKAGRGGQRGSPKAQAVSPARRGRGAGQSLRGRGGRAGRGGGRGGGAAGTTKVKLSKEDLDKDLEQYMSKTKGALNKELDNYMSGLNADVEMN